MAFEQKEGQGSLFPNDRKMKDTHPDWKGEIKINGKLYWLSGWDKKSGTGSGFISIAIGDEKQPKGQGGRNPRQSEPPQQQRSAPPQSRTDDSADVPF